MSYPQHEGIDTASLANDRLVLQAVLISVQASRFLNKENMWLIDEVIEKPEDFDLIQLDEIEPESLRLMKLTNPTRYKRANKIHRDLQAFRCEILQDPQELYIYLTILNGILKKNNKH